MTEPVNDAAAGTAEVPATKEKLDELTQAASLQYSLKNFAAAADHYANAAEIQSKLNGEMAPENAELLFNYGRALYKVAIAKSDVLGTKVAQEEKKKKKPKAKKVKKEESIPEEESAPAAAGKEPTVQSKPFFQLTGMENFDDSDEEEEDGDGEEEEEDQDDFGDAFDMFEIARVLYHKQLETLEGDSAEKGKGKANAELTPEARAIREKLADIYGFLTDLSFESERFHDAIPDARKSLEILEELHPFGHEKVTSAHYTLSLALEFASVAKIREQQANSEAAPDTAQDQDEDIVDWDLRNEASKHTELAIQNQEAHLKKAEESLSSETFTPERKKELEAELADKKSMLEDLKTRVSPTHLIQRYSTLIANSSPTSKKTPQSKRSTPSTRPSSKACWAASQVPTPQLKRPRLRRRQSPQMTYLAWSRLRRRRSPRLRRRRLRRRRRGSESWRLKSPQMEARGRRRRRCSEGRPAMIPFLLFF